MGEYSTKAFFKQRLKEHLLSDGYFEVCPAPDCCKKCEEKANKKIAIAAATKEDYPPFHRECRCTILPLGAEDKAESLIETKAKYASGEFPMKRCHICNEWTEGNSVLCKRCGSPQ